MASTSTPPLDDMDDNELRRQALFLTKDELHFQLSGLERALMQDQVDLNALRLRYNRARTLNSQFFRVCYELKKLDSSRNFDEENKAFEDQYFNINAKIEQYLNRPAFNVDNANGTPATYSLQHYLPTLHLKPPELPEFSGRYEEWQSFYQMFSSLVDNNVAISPIEKFHRLRSALSKKPKESIQHLDFTEPNYKKALLLLKEKYDNKRSLIHQHIRHLFNLNSSCVCKKETTMTASSIENMINVLNQTFHSLASLQVDMSSWDPILEYTVTAKFDDATSAAWENSVAHRDPPTREEIISFLKKRQRVLESLERKVSSVSKYPKTSYPVSNISKDSNTLKRRATTTHGFMQLNNPKIRKIERSRQNEERKRCEYCNEYHTLNACQGFRKLSINDRWKIVKSQKLCAQCLKAHDGMCKNDYFKCAICNKNHNVLLHVDRSGPHSSMQAARQDQNKSKEKEI